MTAISHSLKQAVVLLALCIAGVLLYSCQQVVSVDLNSANPQMVVEGVIKDQAGPYSVVLSKTGSYFDSSLVTPPVSDALVIMADDLGQRDTLRETVPGTYETSTIQGTPGTTYASR